MLGSDRKSRARWPAVALALAMLAPAARAEEPVTTDDARDRPRLVPFQSNKPAPTEADPANGDGQKAVPALRKEPQPQAGPEMEWVCEELAPPKMFCYRKSGPPPMKDPRKSPAEAEVQSPKPDEPQSASTETESGQPEAAVPAVAPPAPPLRQENGELTGKASQLLR